MYECLKNPCWVAEIEKGRKRKREREKAATKVK
jgi:hypothetical protein